jgi:NAD(P)-dependent dehydrogenase (short-subunit alcohol dehydrogenase family)
MKPIDGSVMLVTGAGRGVGRSLAVTFANQGAHVAAQDITPVNLDATMQLIHKTGTKGLDLIGDMSKKMQVQGMIECVRESLGEIDILINHATVAPAVDLLSVDEWDWDRTMGINLKGYFLAIQSIGRLMRDRAQGLIINMVIPPTRFVESQPHPAYEISAAGIREMTRQAAYELGQCGVGVFAVEVVRERAGRPSSDQARVEHSQDWWQRDPESIAAVVIDLCSRPEKIAAGEVILINKDGLDR